MKKLEEMSREELWQLFPITLVPHEDAWAQWYEEERQRIHHFFPAAGARIGHIGSTAIKGICAKPIVDMLVELPLSADMQQMKKALAQAGYLCMLQEPKRISLNRGYTPQGYAKKVFHLHLRYFGDNDELYFRDYLNGHPAAAKQYAHLKCALAEQYKYNRDAYTEAKAEFIQKITEKAKAVYQNRYA